MTKDIKAAVETLTKLGYGAYGVERRDAINTLIAHTIRKDEVLKRIRELNIPRRTETLQSAKYLMKPDVNAIYETDAGRRNIVMEVEILIDELSALNALIEGE